MLCCPAKGLRRLILHKTFGTARLPVSWALTLRAVPQSPLSHATCFGAMAKEIVGARPLTSFDKGISKVSWMLIRFLMVMTPLVFFINGIDKGDWLQSLLFAVSVAVGLTPDMLPIIVTTNLTQRALPTARRTTTR